jgi:uncharacterized protein
MKIRTITLGLPGIPTPDIIKWAGNQLECASDFFISEKYSVQTRRISLSHWNSGLGLMHESERTATLQMADFFCNEKSIDFCSIGLSNIPNQIDYISQILVETSRLVAGAEISTFQNGVNRDSVSAAAKAIKHLASETESGFGNFRFGAAACLSDGNPFFPGAYHQDEYPKFTLGFENSDLLVKAFVDSGDIEVAKQNLLNILTREYSKIEELALTLSKKLNLRFGGIDTSIAPSLEPNDSIVRAFEAVNIEFGECGTLAVCGAITYILKQIPVKRTGYCGIMLPILEDVGLAQAVDNRKVSVTNLLAYSSVCGVGVDMLPLSGDVPSQQLEGLMLDVSTIALKLKKPLLVRVLPILGKYVGDKTQIESPYVCNSRIVSL